MNKIFLILASIILKIILNIIFVTCNWKVANIEILNDSIKSKSPLLICSWHQRFLFVARYFKNFNKEIWAISSTHKDSEIMARILKGWNWKLIRGSSTRGWRNVIIQMKQKLSQSDGIIAITNDGPKGPPKIAKTGSISLAIKKNADIIAISCSPSRFWKLKSWDETYIPKPFSTIHVSFSRPLDYKNIKLNEVEMVNQYLNTSLDQLDKSIKI